jgi:uncharacterized protein YjiS (DUF1127 family)
MAIHIQFDLSALTTPRVRGVSQNRPLDWFRAARARWRERRALEELDDRMLHDIGISRSQALAEASKPFWVP